MNKNEKFVLVMVSMGCTFGLLIHFMPDNKAALYSPIPTALVNGALTYLGLSSKKDNDDT